MDAGTLRIGVWAARKPLALIWCPGGLAPKAESSPNVSETFPSFPHLFISPSAATQMLEK